MVETTSLDITVIQDDSDRMMHLIHGTRLSNMRNAIGLSRSDISPVDITLFYFKVTHMVSLCMAAWT